MHWMSLRAQVMQLLLAYKIGRTDQREGIGARSCLPFLTWLMPDGCVHLLCITAAGNSISSQLGSSCQGCRYGVEKESGNARPSRTESHLPGHSPPASQADRLVGPALYPSASVVQILSFRPLQYSLPSWLLKFTSCSTRYCLRWKLYELSQYEVHLYTVFNVLHASGNRGELKKEDNTYRQV